MIDPVIVVHGGAWDIPDNLVEAHDAGCAEAARRALAVLVANGCAEDAVQAAVASMEDDPIFDAGRGSFLNQDGIVELDAAIMDGAQLQVGAVAAVQDIANPIVLARMVMTSPHAFLVGEGASRYAENHGMARCLPDRLVVGREVAAWEAYAGQNGDGDPWGHSDTVGAIALDARGHLAAAVSTGGRPYKLAGRVGDVPCAGCGFYADDAVGAAVSTGEGEAILRVVLAKRATDRMASGLSAESAAKEAIGYLWQRIGGHAGLITLDRRGRVGCTFNTARMARAWSQGERVFTAVDPDD